jgi:hypothetical protein
MLIISLEPHANQKFSKLKNVSKVAQKMSKTFSWMFWHHKLKGFRMKTQLTAFVQ